jgi:hypothetical protein
VDIQFSLGFPEKTEKTIEKSRSVIVRIFNKRILKYQWFAEILTSEIDRLFWAKPSQIEGIVVL